MKQNLTSHYGIGYQDCIERHQNKSKEVWQKPIGAPFEIDDAIEWLVESAPMHSTSIPRLRQMPFSQRTDIHELSMIQSSYKACASANTMDPNAHHNSQGAAPLLLERGHTDI